MAASQKGKSDVSQHAGHVDLRVGAFNIGIHQEMMAPKAWCKHERRFKDLVIKAMAGDGLHLFSCCEVGGHLQGPKHAGAQLQRPVDELKAGWEVVCEQNYANIFYNVKADDKLQRAHDDDDANLTLKRKPETYAMKLIKNEPQLVISEFAVHKLPTKPQTGEGTLVVGSLHIRTPSGTEVTVAEKIRTTMLSQGLHLLRGSTC